MLQPTDTLLLCALLSADLLISQKGWLQLADLGLAKETEEAETKQVGTHQYNPPEIRYEYNGQDIPKDKSDVFNIGSFLCEVLTGTRPDYRKHSGWLALEENDEDDESFDSETYPLVSKHSWVAPNDLGKKLAQIVEKMLHLNQESRCTAKEAHEMFVELARQHVSDDFLRRTFCEFLRGHGILKD